MICLDLFIGFLRVGLFAFGGAYGAIPLIREIVLSYGWLTDAELTYMIAVSESTPGPIMVNLATYVGSSQAGIFGAILATFAVVLPAFLIILFVMILLKSFLQNRWVQAVLHGMTPCVIGIVLATGAFMTFSSCFGSISALQPDLKAIIIAVLLVSVMLLHQKLRKKKLSPILIIVFSAFLGMLIYGF